jgi:hypothetical protein
LTLVDVPEVCVFWLALAPALVCPGVTEALPEAEAPAEVWAVALIANKPAVIAAIQNILMLNPFPFSQCFLKSRTWMCFPVTIQMQIV